MKPLVECLYRYGVDISNDIIKDEVERRLSEVFKRSPPVVGVEFTDFTEDCVLQKALTSLSVSESKSSKVDYSFYHYQFKEQIQPKADTAQDEDNMDFYHLSSLPACALHGLWESLYFEDYLATDLFDYVKSVIISSSFGLNLKIFDLHKYDHIVYVHHTEA